MKLFKLLTVISTSAAIGSTATALVATSSTNNRGNSVEQGQSHSNSNTYYYSFTSDSAKEIINEIVNKNITVPNNTNPDISNLRTIKTIKTFLQKNNFKLTNADLSCISIYPVSVGEILSTAKANLLLVVKVNGKIATTYISVKLAAN